MEWYIKCFIKNTKIDIFFIQKTTKCYKVDAGGMFSPCLEGLATVRHVTKLIEYTSLP